jgi:hypothetical protein
VRRPHREPVRLTDHTDGKARDRTQAVTARVVLEHRGQAEWARDPAFKDPIESGDAKDEVVLAKTNEGWPVAS